VREWKGVDGGDSWSLKAVTAGKGGGGILMQFHVALGSGSEGPTPAVVREQRARPTVGRHNRGMHKGGGPVVVVVMGRLLAGCRRLERIVTFLIY
jgi:hypothetical protein